MRKLAEFPPSDSYKDEPWYTLWSSLCHQGDVYPASFAAVPHVVLAAAQDPLRATYSYFLLPACIEIARIKKQVSIPAGFDPAYFESLLLLFDIVGKKTQQTWDEDFTSSALAAMAAAKGHVAVAEIILELESDAIPDVLMYVQNR